MKKAQLRTGNMVLILLVAGILAAVNIISQRYFLRLDLTDDKRYSVAPSTRALLEGMDDVVNVDAYFSRDLPPRFTELRRQVEDLLDEYRAYSQGRVHVEFKDPGNDPIAQQKLRSLGIPQVQLEVLERDKAQLTNAYLGIALHYGGRKEAIPVVQNVSRLEYELTGALVRLMNPEKKGLGWIASAAAPMDPFGRRRNLLLEELGRFYEVSDLEPNGLVEIPESLKTVVVAGPRELSDGARFALDQFLMKGGSVIFLVDHFSLPPGTIFPTPMESGVHDLIEHYGVRVNKDVVVEPHRSFSATAVFSGGFLPIPVPYPYWPRISGEHLNREHPVTSALNSIVLPWTSSLEVIAGEGAGVKAEVLASSSPLSWTVSGRYDFSPPNKLFAPPAKDAQRSRPLIALLTGRFRSFWEGREPPAPAGDQGPAPVEGESPPTVVAESPETSILVVGSSQPVKEEFLRQFQEDGIFLLNAIDWMTFGSQLIGIRSRTGGERILHDLSPAARTTLKVANVVVLPVLVAMAGMLFLVLRRRKSSVT